MSQRIEKRVVIAKSVAVRWLDAHAKVEHRLQVFYGAKEIKSLVPLLRSFRDNKVRLAKLDPIPDLGVQEGMDSFTVWTSDREGLLKLKDWFERRGLETSGVW